MISAQSTVAQLQAQDSVTNLKGLQGLKNLSGNDRDQALRQMSKQFESLFLHMMLKSMRSANEVFEQDNELNSFELKMHRDMLDQQMALSLSKGAGIGLADTLYRQLKQEPSAVLAKEPSAVPATAPRENPNPQAQRSRPEAKPESKSSAGLKQPMFSSPREFVRGIMPYAKAAAQKLGVEPRVLIAQAALETGWGRHIIHDSKGKSGFNLFNIKADTQWNGDRISISTLEYKDGLAARERADFRRYNNLAESFADYVNFLSSRTRYQPALSAATDSASFLHELHRAGYATDPDYADKVLAVLDSDYLKQAGS